MSTLEIKVYEIFKSKLGEKEAETIIQYIDEKAKKKINEKKDVFLTKDDKVDLIKWMVGLWIATISILSGVMFALLHIFIK